MRRPLRLLLIGPLPPPAGGATVLFRQLARELGSHSEVDVRVVDTSREPGLFHLILQAGIVMYRVCRFIRWCDVVSFHSSRQGAALFGPVVSFLSWINRKKWLFRGFGDFEGWHKKADALKKGLLRHSVLRANVVLLETKSSVAYFREITEAEIHWYPNSRPLLAVPRNLETERKEELRFVFIGHVKPSKGIRELLNAAERFERLVVDVYGPLLEGVELGEFHGKNARYCGQVEPESVPAVLARYDVLLLPTFYEGEGYPGIIVEAFSQGVPVIASRWGAIPEMVNAGNGILVEAKSSTALADAMSRLIESRDTFVRLREGANASKTLYSSEIWTKVLLDLARELCESDLDDR